MLLLTLFSTFTLSLDSFYRILFWIAFLLISVRILMNFGTDFVQIPVLIPPYPTISGSEVVTYKKVKADKKEDIELQSIQKQL